jgi:hypothetical protein
LAGNAALYTWPSLGCPSAIGWHEELVAAVGRPTTIVLRGKGRFAFVGMFPHTHGLLMVRENVLCLYLNSSVLTTPCLEHDQ